ncbi:MAG: hypothetical protein WCO71_05560, partial [Pseudomonadota bacterium]
ILTGSNQWDLVKNTVNYFIAPVAAMSLGPIVAQFPVGWELTRGFVPFVALIMTGSVVQSVLVLHSKSGFLGASIRSGVFKQAKTISETAYIADYLWRQNKQVKMLIDSRCGVTPCGNLQYLSPRAEMPIVENVIAELEKGISTSQSIRLLTNSSGVGEITRIGNLKVVDQFAVPGKDLLVIEVETR